MRARYSCLFDALVGLVMRNNQLVVAEDPDSFTTMLSSLKLEAGSPGPLEAGSPSSLEAGSPSPLEAETPCPLEEEAPGSIEVETSGLLKAETPSPLKAETSNLLKAKRANTQAMNQQDRDGATANVLTDSGSDAKAAIDTKANAQTTGRRNGNGTTMNMPPRAGRPRLNKQVAASVKLVIVESDTEAEMPGMVAHNEPPIASKSFSLYFICILIVF